MTVDVGVLNEADPPVTWWGMGLHVLAFLISCLNFCVCFSNIIEVYINLLIIKFAFGATPIISYKHPATEATIL